MKRLNEHWDSTITGLWLSIIGRDTLSHYNTRLLIRLQSSRRSIMDVQEPEDLEEDVDLDIIRRIASEEDDPSSNREEEESESSEESSSSEEEEEEDQNIIILRQGEFQSHAKGARRRKTNTFFHKPKPTSSPRGKGTVQLIQNLTTNVHSLRFKNFSVENPDSIGLYVVLVRDSGGQAFDVTNVRHLRELETRSVVLHLDLGLQGQVRGARVNDHQGSFFEQSLALANPLDVSHVLIAKPATARPATVVPDVHCLASLQVYVEPVPVQVQAHVRRKTTQLQAQWWKVQQSQQPLMILDEHTIETEASKIFRRADADESGTVDFHEFWKMLEQYGLTVLEPQARRFFRLCDRLGEGEMDQEYVDLESMMILILILICVCVGIEIFSWLCMSRSRYKSKSAHVVVLSRQRRRRKTQRRNPCSCRLIYS